MTDNWCDLAIPYFVPTCRDVFDAYFTAHGFHLEHADPAGRVIYSNNRSFVEISYWLEDAPEFVPMAAIGVDSKYLFATRAAFNRIGIWYAIPENVDAREYSTWRFSDAQELATVLRRLRDKVIDVYAKPLWLCLERLATLIDRRYQEVLAAHTEEVLEKKRLDAEVAFRSGNYEQMLAIYDDIGTDSLTPAERKRFEIAAKRIRPSVTCG